MKLHLVAAVLVALASATPIPHGSNQGTTVDAISDALYGSGWGIKKLKDADSKRAVAEADGTTVDAISEALYKGNWRITKLKDAESKRAVAEAGGTTVDAISDALYKGNWRITKLQDVGA
ncbi:hypothetical protein OCS_02572 [Ophiocordyceps sinensis CO18]|uniref:Uncharacterized protein n=1 Tax=Ophiocordyceps sinensis (strain Co18 / CGMCC 3.14243) TaxID=911162 RepID=T5AGM0_OPHSC|nr:hypothetical protein OCS_02572 [Ophiocordyceps sinensis CO18]